ncbi:MAG TPA: alkaline phosphatase family protein [Bacteroidota bacterium]|nr:alkaline phosphatase family protein [Bacteroidota bacterium]
MKKTISPFVILLLFPPAVTWSQQLPQPPRPPGVVVIGVDALSNEGLQFSNTPNIDILIRRGALSLATRAVMPTVSAPNWSSMLMGAGPEQHGITRNGWTRANTTIVPADRDADGYFPSIFKIVREQMPRSKTAMFYDWDELANFYNPKDIDAEVFSKDYHETVLKAASYIVAERPAFTFIYIGHADDVGHESGHGTESYWKSVADVDEALGDLFSELIKGGLFDSLLFFVITDHGGVGHGHGGESMDEIEVPWIVSGPGTLVNRMLVKPNNSLNTASTVAWALGLRQPDSWIGRPVLEAFEARAAGPSYTPRPRISAASGVYLEPQRVEMTTKEENTPIRYTIDGTEPGLGSPVYRNPITIDTATIVRAVSVGRRGLSAVTTKDIAVVKGVKTLALGSAPADKYSAGGALALVDGKRGSDRHNDGRWLGFEGNNLDLLFDFGSPRELTSVSVGCLNDTGSWIFLPASADLFTSSDGAEFQPVRKFSSDLMKMRNSVKGAQGFTLSLEEFRERYLRVVVKNIGLCPPGHSSEGKKAWLFVDEVIIR